MKLSQFNTPFKRLPVFVYARDGRTVLRKKIYLQQIKGSLYKSKNYEDSHGLEYCSLYDYYPSIGAGLWLCEIVLPSKHELEVVTTALRDSHFETSEAFIAAMDQLVEAGAFISKGQIALANAISAEKGEAYAMDRAAYDKRQDAEEEKRKVKKAEEDAAYCAAKNAAAEAEILNAVSIIRNGGVLQNTEISIYRSRYDGRTYHLVNYIARRYGVTIPLKVQGWINRCLASVTVEDGKAATYRYFRHSTRNESATFLGYMDRIIQAVLDEDAQTQGAAV